MSNDPSARAPRSELRLRARPHIQPGREDEAVVEVVRGGEVVGTIYGSREGIHVVSGFFGRDGGNVKVIGFDVQLDGVQFGNPGLVVAMLRPGELCPWCGRKVAGKQFSLDCPLCGTETSPKAK